MNNVKKGNLHIERVASQPGRKRRFMPARNRRAGQASKPIKMQKDTPEMLWRPALVFLGVVLADAFVPPVGLLICLALSAYALKGPREVLHAFSILALLLLLGNAYSSIGRWLVMFACFGRLMWDSIMQGASTPRIITPLLLFSFTIFVFAFLVSYIPAVSVLKIVTFFMGVSIIMVAFHRTPHLRQYWFSWIFTLCVFILLASLPLFGFEYGYRKTGTGFQGILSHPQTFGIVGAIIAAFITGLLLYNGKKSKLIILATVIAWVGIFASEARTALLAVVLGFAISLIIGSMAGAQWRQMIGRSFSAGKVLFFAIALCGFGLVLGSTIQDGVLKFLMKDDSDESVTAALQDSRGAVIELSMENFYANPVTGIGFGVPSEPSKLKVKSGPMGIPTGASVEKGFMPSAVLEETGLAGAFLVMFIIIVLFKPVLTHGGMMALWLMSVCFSVNLGEMIFFAIGGGAGTFLWLMLGFTHFYMDPEFGSGPRGQANARLQRKASPPMTMGTPVDARMMRRKLWTRRLKK